MDFSLINPTTRPELLAAVAGIVLGSIATIISWAKDNSENWTKKTSTFEAIKNDSRAAMVYIALVGFLGAIGIDWDWKTVEHTRTVQQQTITGKANSKANQNSEQTSAPQQREDLTSKPTKFDIKARVGFFYIIYYLAFGFMTLVVACIVMYKIGKNKRKGFVSKYTPPPGQTVLNYIKFGYLYAIYELENNELTELRQLQEGESTFNAKRNKAFSDLCARTVKLLHNPEEGAKRELITSVLESLRNNSMKYMGQHCNANYMEAIPVEQVKEQLNLHFSHNDNPNYTHYLVLRSWASNDHEAPGEFALPVEADEHGAECAKTLPGAPTAFVTSRAVIMELSTPYENPSLPIQVVREINDYFAPKSLKCFISTRIPVKRSDNKEWLGVINIESNDDLLVNLEPEDHNNFRDSILAFGALLGIVATVKV